MHLRSFLQPSYFALFPHWETLLGWTGRLEVKEMAFEDQPSNGDEAECTISWLSKADQRAAQLTSAQTDQAVPELVGSTRYRNDIRK